MAHLLDCFFVTPIGNAGSEQRIRADKVQKFILAPIAKNFLNVTRADEVDDPGTITTDIVQRLYNNPLVVADLTGHNPNVMYEVGLRHCFNLPIVHFAQVGERPPFDLAAERIIFFDITDIESVENAKHRMRSACKAALEAKPFRSPVVKALERETLFAESVGLPTTLDLAERLEAIETAIERSSEDAVSASYDVASEVAASFSFDVGSIGSKRIEEISRAFDLVSPNDILTLAKVAKRIANENNSK